MYRHHLKTAIRHLRRNRTSSLINVLGFASGLTVGILLYNYVSWENSYDTFYANNQRIYRISYTKFLNGRISEALAKSPAALARTITEELPEVTVATQIYPTIGLFGLSVDIISRRTKEIGIRKVLGASVSHLTFILVKGQLLLSVVGFLVAAPISYLVLNNWLNGYAFRTAWPWWVFAVPLLLLVVLSVATVGS